MSSIPKGKVMFVGGHELVACVGGSIVVATQLVVSKSVEVRAVGVEGLVDVDGGGGDFDHGAGGYELAVGEGDAFEDFTGECCCWRMVLAKMRRWRCRVMTYLDQGDESAWLPSCNCLAFPFAAMPGS